MVEGWQIVSRKLVDAWQGYSRSMADGCYGYGRVVAEVWQSEEGSSRSAEHQGSDEKKAT